jgi:putative transcriptional regulator
VSRRAILNVVDSLAGKLIVSSPSLVDPNFRRTVVLMTHHDEDGAMGLVLSRPSEIPVAEAVPGLADLPGADEVVYVGGPVQPEVIVALAELEEPDDAVPPVVGTVGFIPGDGEPDELRIARIRVFAGYSGWGPGQLEAEMEESSWIVVPAEPDDVFAPDPDELWRTVLNRKGGRYALIATMPFDPSLN